MEARKAAQMSQEQLASQCGVSQKTISKIERGDQHGSTKIAELAAALRVSPHWLGTGRGRREPGSAYPERAPTGAEPSMEVVGIPVVGTAQAGDDGYWEELQYPPGHGDGYIRYSSSDPNAYALRVRGDSMRPRIKPGEFIIIEPNFPIAQGDEVLLTTTDGRSMVKVLGPRRDGMVELQSINEDHRPITLDLTQIRTMHHVAGIVKSSRHYRS